MLYRAILTALCGYLLGNLNGAVCMSLMVSHDDVRSHGSGNAGLTNFVRNFGRTKGIAVLVIDALKTALACLVGGALFASYSLEKEGMMLGALMVSLGHDFPALLGFKGGKGIVCGATIALCVDWRIFLVLCVLFFLPYLTTGYVSLGSVLAALGLSVAFGVVYWQRPVVAVCGIALGLLAVFMHRENISRLLHGQERKSNLFGKGKKQ